MAPPVVEASTPATDRAVTICASEMPTNWMKYVETGIVVSTST